MTSKFDELVRSLAPDTLEDLQRRVTEEVRERRRESAIQIESIRADMSGEAREQALLEIARVLRGEDSNA